MGLQVLEPVSRLPHAPMGLQVLVPVGRRSHRWDFSIGFIIEYYLIVINIASVKRKIIKPKYPVACSRSVGAAWGTGFIMEYYLIVINPPTKKAKHGSDIT